MLTACTGCGGPLPEQQRRANPRKWCSERCRVKTYYQSNLEARRKASRDAHTPAPPVKWCALCAGPIRNRPDSRYCIATIECRRAAARDRASLRRARMAGVTHERFKSVEVYDRDGWVCQLCDEPVDQAARHPDPMSASLDHIIPIARGGSHTRANTQLAHLMCNILKGTKIGTSHSVTVGLT